MIGHFRVELFVNARLKRTLDPVVRVHVDVLLTYIVMLVHVLVVATFHRRRAFVAYFAEFNLEHVVRFAVYRHTLISTRANQVYKVQK